MVLRDSRNLETRVLCLQIVLDGSEFADKMAYVQCGNCQDRIQVETVTHLHDVSYFYAEETIVMGRVGLSLRAFCDWKCASKVAKIRAK